MKKVLSILLAVQMFLASTQVFASTVVTEQANKEFTNPIADSILTESAKKDTSVFEGAPAYILQDAFNAVSVVDALGIPSGWNFDKRGGAIIGKENAECKIIDTSDIDLVSISRDLMPHKSGKLTFETAFTIENKAETGYSYTIFGGDKTIFKIETDGDKLVVLEPGGTKKQVATYKVNEIIRIKVIFDIYNKTYNLIIDGELTPNLKFAEDAIQIDRILISTSNEKRMTVLLRYVHMYINYAVNETFMQTPVGQIPYDWKEESGSAIARVVDDASQVYPDLYSYGLYDPTAIDAVNLSKTFDEQKGRVVFGTRFIAEKKGDVVISIGNGNTNAVTVKTANADIVTGNGQIVKANYKENVWYTLKIVLDTDTKKSDIYLNYQKVLEDVPFEGNVSGLNKISYKTEIKKTASMRIDDIQVYQDITPADYVEKPAPVKPEGNLEVGMQMYSMWHENHFGWDWITAYPDRIPYLGTYAEGKPEVADWTIKWQTEHGFTFRTEVFSRAVANINQPVKLPTRYNALYDGYFNAKYKDDIKFTFLYSGISTSNLGGIDDFKNNIVPHFIENFFTQPNFLTKDNKPVMFMYDAMTFVKIMGGMDKANEAIAYLGDECKKLGFDGVIVVPDGRNAFLKEAPNFAQKYVYSYGWEYEARNAKAQLASNDGYFLSHPDINFVANVSMGWGRNPWTETNQGELFVTPEDVKVIVNGLKERFKTANHPTNMITFTCWDEYGEGHFFAPTRVHGFEYLNAVRESVTGLGEKQTEELPTANALARMNSLYFGGKRFLKMITENPAPVYYEDSVDHSKLQVLAEWDFEKMTNLGGWKAYKDVTNVRLEDGALRADVTDKDPGVWIEGISIPAKDVQMIKVTTQTEGVGNGHLFYGVDVDDTEPGTGGKKFKVKQDSLDFKEYEGYPTDRNVLEGNIDALRWDPKEMGYPYYTKFAVKKIQILGYPYENDGVEEKQTVGLTYNNVPLKITQPAFVKDGVTYFAINRPLYEMGIFKTKFDYPKGTYTIEYENSKAVITIGSNIMNVDGKDVDLGAPAYYEAGNLFVPVKTTMEGLGATVTWNGETKSIDLRKRDSRDTYQYQDDVSPIPFTWTFETTSTEGWESHMQTTVRASRGALVIGMMGNDPAIMSSTFRLPASEYKYMKIRIKNESAFKNVMILFTKEGDTTWGGTKKYTFDISSKDTEFKEYIIDLTTCKDWNGTVNQLRIDPINDAYGSSVTADYYIDSIEFLKELPQ